MEVLSHNNTNIIEILPYGDTPVNKLIKTLMLNASTKFLLSSKIFDVPLRLLKINYFVFNAGNLFQRGDK